VEIIENVEAWFDLPDDCRSSLGSRSGRLGETLVAGRRFADCDSSYQVIVHDVAADRVPEFLPGGSGHRKIEWLLSVCMPGNLLGIITVRTRRDTQPLGKEKRACYLGYTTYA
jgi:predicted component of type VI protein secretion system